MGGIQWFGQPLSDDLPDSNLLHGSFWHSTADFHDSLQEMRDYCRAIPAITACTMPTFTRWTDARGR